MNTPRATVTFKDGNEVRVYKGDTAGFMVVQTASAPTVKRIERHLKNAGYPVVDLGTFDELNQYNTTHYGDVNRAISLLENWRDNGFPPEGHEGNDPPGGGGSKPAPTKPAAPGGSSFADLLGGQIKGRTP